MIACSSRKINIHIINADSPWNRRVGLISVWYQDSEMRTERSISLLFDWIGNPPSSQKLFIELPSCPLVVFDNFEIVLGESVSFHNVGSVDEMVHFLLSILFLPCLCVDIHGDHQAKSVDIGWWDCTLSLADFRHGRPQAWELQKEVYGHLVEETPSWDGCLGRQEGEASRQVHRGQKLPGPH